MIKLQKYPSDRFNEFKETSISEYSMDLMETRKMDEQTARKTATEGLQKAFPEGESTDTNKLLSISAQTDSGEVSVGHIWYSITDETSAYIMDVQVHAEHRGKGYASLAFNVLKEQLQADGLKRIGLRVAPNNAAAIRVYEKAGFHVTGWNMSCAL